MCSSSSQNELNRLIINSDNSNSPILTILYGPYMNWGRWNHNTSRISELINNLLLLGYSIELKHDNTETTPQEHGYVKILSSNDYELVSSDNVQHNRSYNKRIQILMNMAQIADEKFKEIENE